MPRTVNPATAYRFVAHSTHGHVYASVQRHDGVARRSFFAKTETIPWSGVRELNGEDIEVEPTTAFCSKRRLRDKIGAAGSPETTKRDGFAPI